MADILVVFMFLLCCLYVYFMTIAMYGSQHVFTCIYVYDLIDDNVENDMRKQWFIATSR